MTEHIHSKKTFWSVILIFVGVFLLMRNFDILPEEIWLLWPVSLVLLGLIGLSSGWDIGSGKK